MKLGTITHKAPANYPPGKNFRGDGTSTTIGTFQRAYYRTLECNSLTDLAAWMEAQPASVYMTAGRPVADEGEVYTDRVAQRLLEQGDGTCPETGLPIIARTKAFFDWRAGPGLMVIDTDGEGDFATILNALEAVAPALAQCSALQASSSSSRIPKLKRGDKGAHTYLHVMDATDVPRALDVLHKRMCMGGFAQHRVGDAGQFLNRSYVDTHLKNPSQPVFIRATLEKGLKQDKLITLRSGPVEIIDTRSVFPDLTPAEIIAYERSVAQARVDLTGEMITARATHIKARVAAGVDEGRDEQEVRRTVNASLGGHLRPEHPVILSDGTVVTVGKILSEPDKFDCVTCRDPIEPTYGSNTVARINSARGVPMIWSFAHGGARYHLGHDLPDFPEVTPEQWAESQAEAARQAVNIADVLAWDLVAAVENTEAVIAHLDGSAPGHLIPGVGLIVGDQRVVADITRLCDHIEGNVGLVPEWAKHLVAYAGTRNDTIETHITTAAKRLTAVGKVQGRKDLTAAVDAWVEELPRLTPYSEGVEEPDDNDMERARNAAALLSACRRIAENPLEALDKELTRQGVVGERRTARITFLSIASAVTDKPINLINRAQSSSGKSFVTKAVAKLWPESFIFTLSSMSSKALIYLPQGALSHRMIMLEEGEILSREKGEKNEVAEMLRVLLSEGKLTHMVTEKDPVSNQFETRVVEQTGPTGLITTTVRAYLDGEIETRMLSNWLDESEGQTRAIIAAISKSAQSSKVIQDHFDEWHAFGDWMRSGPSIVTIPFAEHLGSDLPVHAVRARRDIRTVLGIVKAAALVNRLKRETDSDGAIIATLDDYDIAVSCVGQAIAEGHEVVASDNAREFLKHVVEKTPGDPTKMPSGDPTGKTGDDPTKMSILVGSIRSISNTLSMAKSTVARRLAHCVSHGYLDQVIGGYFMTAEGMEVVKDEEKAVFPTRAAMESKINSERF